MAKKRDVSPWLTSLTGSSDEWSAIVLIKATLPLLTLLLAVAVNFRTVKHRFMDLRPDNYSFLLTPSQSFTLFVSTVCPNLSMSSQAAVSLSR